MVGRAAASVASAVECFQEEMNEEGHKRKKMGKHSAFFVKKKLSKN